MALRKDVPKLVTYFEPLDLAKLFLSENLSTTLGHICRSFVEKAQESEMNDRPYVYECVGNLSYEMVQIDYLFMVKCLAELCENGGDVAYDFRPKGKDRSEISTVRNGLFLVHGVLETLLSLVYMNGSKSVSKGLNYFVPTVVERAERPMMMMGVNFKRKELRKALNNEGLWEEFYAYIMNKETMLIPNTFGLKPAYNYFNKLGIEVEFLNAY
jgi:hypothetical protein